jgi:hypothetical protein
VFHHHQGDPVVYEAARDTMKLLLWIESNHGTKAVEDRDECLRTMDDTCLDSCYSTKTLILMNPCLV